MARPSPSRAHDDDRLRLPPASSPQNSEAGKKESTVHRLSQLCPPCATPSSKSSLDHRRSVARIAENGFAANTGVSESAKVVLGRVLINRGSADQGSLMSAMPLTAARKRTSRAFRVGPKPENPQRSRGRRRITEG